MLGILQPYFDCELSVDDKDKILELHERFKNDVLIQKVNLDGVELIVKPYLYNCAHKDSLPEWFDGLLEKFVHVITEMPKRTDAKSPRPLESFARSVPCVSIGLNLFWKTLPTSVLHDSSI